MTISPRYIDISQAASVTTLSESLIQEMESKGQFPRRRKLSARRTGYLVKEIDEWCDSRPASDLPPPPNTGAAKTKECGA